MSNKTSDKNVANEERLNNFIEAYKQTKEQSFIVDSINKDFFFEFVDCLLAELEQKDKRIQELENKLQDINTYILINGIDESLRTATQIRVENQHEYIIQQKINKLKEERNHWHGCFIDALESSIPKRVITDLIANETIDISGFECIAVEDLQELLKGDDK